MLVTAAALPPLHTTRIGSTMTPIVVMLLCCIQCSVFEGNFGNRAGTVSVSYSPLLMLGHNDFINNTGPALRVSVSASTYGCFIVIAGWCEGRGGRIQYTRLQ